MNRDHYALRLFEKAKRFGTWNPSEIDFTGDKIDWGALDEQERDLIVRLTSLFYAGERAVTVHLIPLIMVIAQEDRIEEELFLASFLFEEAKHTDFFQRFLEEVIHPTGDLTRYHTPSYRSIFYEALPEALNRLRRDPSPSAQIRAAVTYNMIVEGVLAETGYHAFHAALEREGRMPGLREGIKHVKQDESRHIAYGIRLITRLIAADAPLWDLLMETMNALLSPALGIIVDAFAAYDPIPFGLVEAEFADYALSQFQSRMDRIERARGRSSPLPGDVT
jgi:ribonucleoside-diphosphate reductase beta chain